jgi:hypothetical protein
VRGQGHGQGDMHEQLVLLLLGIDLFKGTLQSCHPPVSLLFLKKRWTYLEVTLLGGRELLGSENKNYENFNRQLEHVT